jgi:hypothetical protein
MNSIVLRDLIMSQASGTSHNGSQARVLHVREGGEVAEQAGETGRLAWCW